MVIGHNVTFKKGVIKFVPILRKGTMESSFPKYLGNRKCLVMTDDSKFDENIEILIDDLINN